MRCIIKWLNSNFNNNYKLDGYIVNIIGFILQINILGNDIKETNSYKICCVYVKHGDKKKIIGYCILFIRILILLFEIQYFYLKIYLVKRIIKKIICSMCMQISFLGTLCKTFL